MSEASRKNPNPQGKGLVPVLAHWRETRPSGVAAKGPGQLLLDWFNSALVLSAQFRFRPVPGRDYYLYLRDGDWRLSLIAPEEWGTRQFGDCLGCCRLQSDMTWSIAPREDLRQYPALSQALARLAESFLSSLDSDDLVEENLPAYRRELPYFQRLLATGLGTSLQESLRRAGSEGVTARQLRDSGAALLPDGQSTPD